MNKSYADLRVLIVDDEDQYLQVHKRLLEELGVKSENILLAKSPKEAGDWAYKSPNAPADLILTDNHMPRHGDGIYMLQLVHGHWHPRKRIPSILITSDRKSFLTTKLPDIDHPGQLALDGGILQAVLVKAPPHSGRPAEDRLKDELKDLIEQYC